MNIFVLVLGIVLSLFSTMSLAYIMTATAMGPWIAPTLVLMAGSFYRLFRISSKESEINNSVTLIQFVGSVGAAIAMGVAWTFPVLYFLDSSIFNAWLAHPLYFAGVLTFFSLAAGGFGSWLAGLFSKKLITDEALPFPVSHLVHKTITSQGESRQEVSLFKGMAFSGFICFLRDGLAFGSHFNLTNYLDKIGLHLMRVYYLFPSYLGKEAAFSINPTAWAIGFIAGFGIALPLLVGLLSKYVILYPLYHHAKYLPYSFFPAMQDEVFVGSFCCGLAVTELLLGFSGFPSAFYKKIKALWWGNCPSIFQSLKNLFGPIWSVRADGSKIPLAAKLFESFEPWIVVAASMLCMTYFKFPLLLQFFILGATALVTYQLCWMGGKLGLAPAGRFITFVMLPALILFKIDAVQITLMCTFVSIALMVAVNLLFGYKIGDLTTIAHKKIKHYNWFGLIIGALAVGVCFWFLCNHFQLGSADLFAQRGKARALLIQTFGFNFVVLIFGVLYGFVLKPCGISPTMLLGGLLMPNELSIALILGALATFVVQKPKEQYPFWSGVFTSETLWILLRIVVR